ncbi:MAG TPA: S8 family serine peptidase [Solirubrobacterales bacterium]|nr:S8 family serine peptidase [Solirubrobacterales bacterium]
MKREALDPGLDSPLLLREGNRVLLDVRFEAGAAGSLDALRGAGAQVVHLSRRYQTVTVAARPGQLSALGALPRVAAVSEVLKPLLRGANCGGSVVSEGDTQLNAANARASFALDGSGVTVGILSDSFGRDPLALTSASGDVTSGDLPGPGSPCGSANPVSVLDDSEAAGSDEGRAMAQIVHDLAPGADLSFATAFSGELKFAEAIRALAAKGAQVIADDVAYLEEPFFQDGPVAIAANEVSAAGVSYFSAAGNDNVIDKQGRNIASWEAPQFRDAAACPADLLALPEFGTGRCMDFNPGPIDDETFGITVAKGATLTIDLQWAQPWNGVSTDLDAYLLDAGGDLLEAGEPGDEVPVAAAGDNISGQKPVEVLQWENDSGAAVEVQLAIDNCEGVCNPGADGADPRLKFIFLQGGVAATEYPQSAGGDIVGPAIFGHAGASGAVGVGAVRYNNSSAPEAFSSRGPVTRYFGPATGTAPAPAIAPQTTPKPDLAATDGGANTFFGNLQAGVWRFFGTSAAAPHAAAVAALVRQANPTASAAQVRAALTDTALPVGSAGPDAVGAGLVDAFGAVAALALPPKITLAKAPEPLSRNRRPTIEFSANRPVNFTCQVDGGIPQPCASPYALPTPLGDGPHGIAVSGVDRAGRVGNSGAFSFYVDTRAPRTRITKHPRKLIRTKKRGVRRVFRFRSSEPDSVFVCKVDRGLLRFCGPRISRRFGVGKHTLMVKAQDRAGNVDRSPAVFRFRVKRVG